MSQLVVPILSQVVWATGDVKLWAELNLHVKDLSGNWHPETFRVDTGTELTTFPAQTARKLDLPMPPNPALG